MDSTVLQLANGETTVLPTDTEWTPFTDYHGLPVTRTRWREVVSHGAVVGLCEIEPGGSFPEHTVQTTTIVQVLSGRGRIRVGAESRPYHAPELFVFLPDTSHAWHDITETTLFLLVVVPV